MNVRMAWKFARILWMMPDTNDGQLAFYSGAAFVLDSLQGADPNDTNLFQSLREQAQEFGVSARTIRAMSDLTDLGSIHVFAALHRLT